MATFRKEWFNPLYFILNDALKKHPEISKVFCYGSKSSAKTFSIGQYIAKECYLNNTDAICFRKESTRIKTTLKKTFSKAIKQTRLQNGYVTQDFMFKTTKGNSIVLTGLDNEDKVKGIEEFGYLLFDELDHYSFEEFEQADLSFRGESAKVFFATWNPISDKIWVKPYLDGFKWNDYELQLPSPESFVKISECGTMLYIKTIYTDNFWTVGSPCGTYGYKDDKLLQKYETLKTTNYKSWLVNCMGEWGIAENKNPFFYALDPTKHYAVNDIIWNKSDVLYLAFDFNISPMTCVVAQLKAGVYLNIIKAYKIRNITIKEFCGQIKRDFPGAIFKVTADPAGNSRSVGYDSVTTTMHSIIRQSLNIGLNQMDKPMLNWNRRDAWQEIRIFCNSVLQHHPNINISPKAAIELINDLEMATTIENEDKLYKTSGDTEFGMHLTDCFIYLLTTYFNTYLKRQL